MNDRSSRSQMFFKIHVFKNFANLQENTGVRVFFNKLYNNFIKKRPRRKCFPVKFAKFLRTSPFFTEHLQWLLLE